MNKFHVKVVGLISLVHSLIVKASTVATEKPIILDKKLKFGGYWSDPIILDNKLKFGSF